MARAKKSRTNFIRHSFLLKSNRLIMNYKCPVNDLQIPHPVVYVYKDNDYGWMDWYRGVPMALLPTTICPGMLTICHIIWSKKSLVYFFDEPAVDWTLMFAGKFIYTGEAETLCGVKAGYV